MYQRLPIDKKTIEKMIETSPEIYEAFVKEYGEDNVINNLLIDLVVLTEDKDIVKSKDGHIKVTKELINEVMKSSNGTFQRYIKEPINKLKYKLTKNDSSFANTPIYNETEIPFTPVILNHDVDTDRQGYILGDSYKVLSLPDDEGNSKLHLLCKAVLINPKAKFNYLNGGYREVSPTILASNRSISEVSFVNIPAQLTNSSLSAEQEKIKTTSDVVDEWTKKIEDARLKAKIERQQSQIKQKEDIAQFYTEQLLKKGVIPSSQRSKMQNMFFQLSSGEETLVANAMLAVGKSPLNHKPRNVFLRGTLDMHKSKDERFLEFSKNNKGKFPSEADLRAEFEKSEIALNISLSSGEGVLNDPVDEIKNKLEALKHAGQLSDECKKILAEYCGHPSVSMEDGSNPVGDGKTTDAGGIEVPNNTSLGAPTEESLQASKTHLEMLEKGFNSLKAEVEAHRARADVAENSLAEIKKTLGV